MIKISPEPPLFTMKEKYTNGRFIGRKKHKKKVLLVAFKV